MRAEEAASIDGSIRDEAEAEAEADDELSGWLDDLCRSRWRGTHRGLRVDGARAPIV
jgi:hypothetical protein